MGDDCEITVVGKYRYYSRGSKGRKKRKGGEVRAEVCELIEK